MDSHKIVQHKRKYTIHDRRTAIQMSLRGATYSEVARAIGCSHPTASKWIRNAGLGKPSEQHLTHGEKIRIRRLYRTGHTTGQIAKIFKRSRDGIRKNLQRMGVKIRPWEIRRDHVKDQYFIEVSETYDFSPLTVQQVGENYGLNRNQAVYRIQVGRKLRKKYGLP